MLKKVTYAGGVCSSFKLASDALWELAEVDVPEKQVERRTQQIGTERCAERDATTEAYLDMPLAERKGVPVDVVAPEVAVASMDGGRMQIMNRKEPKEASESKKKGRYWREDKVGLLASMSSQSCLSDPCPEIPKHFLNAERISQLAKEIKANVKSIDGDSGLLAEAGKSEVVASVESEYEPPELVERSVVATKQNAETFGGLLASAAWSRGFYGAKRRAFLGDGSSANWGVWERHFSSFTPVVDFIHALTYLYGASQTSDSFAEGWLRYTQWVSWLWSGQVSRVIASMADYQAVVGKPQEGDGETHPRSILAESITYFQNQQGRMKYAEYRREGLPITTSHMESTIKQMNHRVKGSEKFWSESGAEAILQLRADLIGETKALEGFWKRREATLACRVESATLAA